MSNMYCRYKNEKYIAHIHDKKITIISKIKQEGFDNYVDVLGKEHSDLFMRELDFGEVMVQLITAYLDDFYYIKRCKCTKNSNGY